MKVSGIIRRVDQLGRIVLPMEMRKYMNIVEGTLLEMTINEDVILLKKYSVIHNLKDIAFDILNSLPDNVDVIILDEEKVVVTTKNLTKIQNKKYNNLDLFNAQDNQVLTLNLGDLSLQNFHLKKIIKYGDFKGAILIKSDDQDTFMILNIINNFILNKI